MCTSAGTIRDNFRLGGAAAAGRRRFASAAGGMGTVAGRFVAALCACLAAIGGGAAYAADAAIRADRAAPQLTDRISFFAGGDVARASYFVWAGIVGAPFGLLHEDGLRVRAMGGGGRYRYRTGAVHGGINEGTVATGEFMLGFRRNLATANVTLYLGANVESQRLAAPDPGHEAQGAAGGVKVALEFYQRLGADMYWTASAAASTVHRAYHARAAYAREHDAFAYGFEAAVNGDARYVEPRAGLFAQSRYGRTTLQLSGGVLSNSENGTSPYATLSLYAPY